MQPQFTSIVDLSKPIKLTPAQGNKTSYEVGDIYFDGIRWQRVAAKADFVFAVQDCTDAVRAVGRCYAPDGVMWSTAAWELVHKINEDTFTGWWK